MIEIEEKEHARLSPSASERWLNCPGSVRLSATLPQERISSIHSATGTVAHEIHEKALTQDKNAAAFLGEVVECEEFSIKVDQNMVDAVQESLDFIRDRIADYEFDGYNVDLLCEMRCSLKYLQIPGLDGGTSDVVIVARKDKSAILDIIDYKHGQGVAVEVEENPQLLSYALGAMESSENAKLDFSAINLIISQPRAFHPRGSIREWSISASDLIDWCDNTLIPGARATLESDPKFNPTIDGCRWCSAASVCPALAGKSQEIAMVDFAEIADPVLPDVKTLTHDQKKLVAVNAPLIREFLNAVESAVHDEILNGSTDYVNEFKIVEKMTRRRFTSDAFDPICSPLLDYMSEDRFYTRKEKTITEIEKELKDVLKNQGVKTFVKMSNEIMEQVTEKPRADLTVAPLSDRRKPAQLSMTSDFEHLSE